MTLDKPRKIWLEGCKNIQEFKSKTSNVKSEIEDWEITMEEIITITVLNSHGLFLI